MKRVASTSLLFACLTSTQLIAYELNTHSAITASAFDRASLFKNPQIAIGLGISTANADTLGPVLFTRTNSLDSRRSAADFEQKLIGFLGVEERSIKGWLMRGAIREDDLTPGGCIFDVVLSRFHGRQPGDCNPPESNINRVLNHFYDPINKSALAFGLYGEKAPNWATGSTDAFNSPNNPSTSENRFTLMDARRAMYYALSGQQPGGIPADESARKAWWATTFYALGSALHLVQDMAQPQHTRNEAHTGSVYEGYINARALGEKTYSIRTSTATSLAPLNYGPSTSVVQFDKYSDFLVNPAASGTTSAWRTTATSIF